MLQLNITTVLSIIGLILSLFNILYLVYTNRKHFHFRVIRLSLLEDYPNHPIELEIEFDNKSRLPIGISRVLIQVQGKKYLADWKARILFNETQKVGKEINDRVQTYTLSLPQNMMGLWSTEGSFYIETSDDFDPQTLLNDDSKIIIYTTRGIKKYSIPKIAREAEIARYVQYEPIPILKPNK